MTVSKMEIVRQESSRKTHRRTRGGDAVQLLLQKPDFEPIEVELERSAVVARNATTAADGRIP
jgi:hypothetical protein